MFDYSKITTMNNLIQVLNDDMFQKHKYIVRKYDSRMNVEDRITFGKADCDRLYNVEISIFPDKITLHCVCEGSLEHVHNLTEKEKFDDNTIESLIIMALGKWKYYTLG